LYEIQKGNTNTTVDEKTRGRRCHLLASFPHSNVMTLLFPGADIWRGSVQKKPQNEKEDPL